MVTGTVTDMIISDRMVFNNLLFVSTVINDHLLYSIPTIVTRRRRSYTVSSNFLRYQVVFSIFTWITPPERPDVIVCYVLVLNIYCEMWLRSDFKVVPSTISGFFQNWGKC